MNGSDDEIEPVGFQKCLDVWRDAGVEVDLCPREDDEVVSIPLPRLIYVVHVSSVVVEPEAHVGRFMLDVVRKRDLRDAPLDRRFAGCEDRRRTIGGLCCMNVIIEHRRAFPASQRQQSIACAIGRDTARRDTRAHTCKHWEPG